MKTLFDKVSHVCAKDVTKTYSTSFSSAVRMLAPSIRQDIYNIYGFVRLADEIVDTFHDYNKSDLFSRFANDVGYALRDKISLNPILNAFQETVYRCNIDQELIDAFMTSMEADLTKTNYSTKKEYEQYIYGSADVVGLMCLKVFVKGNTEMYNRLKDPAMRLGSAFQKVNFLRDLKNDFELLNRSYFPDANLNELDEQTKSAIIAEIEDDFSAGLEGIAQLPLEAKFGVYTAYMYYKALLRKLKGTPSYEIINRRIRVPNYQKYGLFAKSYVDYKLRLI